MPDNKSSVINIALVGGETYCKEVLEKTNLGFIDSEVSSRIIAVADPNPDTPGMALARKLGLKTVSDYYELYLPENHIDLIIIRKIISTLLLFWHLEKAFWRIFLQRSRTVFGPCPIILSRSFGKPLVFRNKS